MLTSVAEIIVDNRAVQTDRPFTYAINPKMENLIKEGMRVIVPFGRGNRNIKGIVINILDEFSGDYKLKEIIDVLDDKPLISKELLSLSKWMKEYYLSSYLDSLQTVLPPGDFKEIETFVSLENELELESEEEEIIVEYLKDKKMELLSKLKTDLNLTGINQILEKLENQKIIKTTIDISTRISKKTERWVEILNRELTLEESRERIGTRANKQLEIMEYIFKEKSSSLEQVLKAVSTTDATVKALEKKELIKITYREVQRDPIKREIADYKKHELNKEQKLVFTDMVEKVNEGESNRFLLHGVTGSGKTEIYLQLVEKMIEDGKDSIILVPEISLTPQTIDRFVGRFQDDVAVLHSGLSHGERFDQWRMIKEGKVKIVVGARSAVFAPFNNLGLIVIDEEHETTYKSSNNPKYDTIEVASKRIELEGASLLLGSATPSIETYYKASKGEILLYELNHRVNKDALPNIDVIDMREELNLGNRSIFSRNLYKSIEENLKSEKQTILFLNRRGFSTFVSCRSCGYVVKCDDCEVSMTYHHNINRVKCHYCGKTEISPVKCPECGSEYIRYFGIGTERVEEMTRKYFPEARVARMDADTMGKKGSYEKTLGMMKEGKIDILIGTQMISKGLDFKNVTLVGIIAADTTLNLPDFRSPERAFQLVTQVAGRAGRGEYKGNVILQTYDPDHYSIKCSKEHDFNKFYKEEIKIREEFEYPPYTNLISILLYGRNNIRVSESINKMGRLLKENIHWLDLEEINNIMSGPYPAPLEKIRNQFRWQIILKIEDKYMNLMKETIKKICLENEYNINMKDIKMSIDINPNSIL